MIPRPYSQATYQPKPPFPNLLGLEQRLIKGQQVLAKAARYKELLLRGIEAPVLYKNLPPGDLRPLIRKIEDEMRETQAWLDKARQNPFAKEKDLAKEPPAIGYPASDIDWPAVISVPLVVEAGPTNRTSKGKDSEYVPAGVNDALNIISVRVADAQLAAQIPIEIRMGYRDGEIGTNEGQWHYIKDTGWKDASNAAAWHGGIIIGVQIRCLNEAYTIKYEVTYEGQGGTSPVGRDGTTIGFVFDGALRSPWYGIRRIRVWLERAR